MEEIKVKVFILLNKLFSCYAVKPCPILLWLHKRLLCSWNSPGRKTGGGCHFLLQGIISNQGSSPFLWQWQADSFPLSHQGRHLFNICIYKYVMKY